MVRIKRESREEIVAVAVRSQRVDQPGRPIVLGRVGEIPANSFVHDVSFQPICGDGLLSQVHPMDRIQRLGYRSSTEAAEEMLRTPTRVLRKC